MGYAISGPAVIGLLNGCEVDTSSDWKPAFFDQEEIQTIAEIAETILPETDTPGAKSVLVHRFVDKMVKYTYDIGGQATFLKGIVLFRRNVQDQYNKDFTKCTLEERHAILSAYEQKSAKFPFSVWGSPVAAFDPPPFYRQLKELILLGYFASEQIGENELNYDPIPGKYVGCVPTKDIGKSWAFE